MKEFALGDLINVSGISDILPFLKLKSNTSMSLTVTDSDVCIRGSGAYV